LAPELANLDAPISGALTSFAGLPSVTVGGYALGQAPNDQIDLSLLALESTSQSILTRANDLPTLTQMEASSILTAIADLSGIALETTSQATLARVNTLPTLANMEGSTSLTAISDLSGVNSSLTVIQTALANVATDARAAKNLSAAGL
ncbi:MAG: hypothetical protein AAFX51_12300, partial [Cyanobacteria bacterium J06636_28]